MGNFSDFITMPDNDRFNIQEQKPRSVSEKADYITNGDIISQAIRERDNVLKFHMEQRFKDWCDETGHSSYSVGDKKYWKTLRFDG